MSMEALHDVYITEETTDREKFSRFIIEYHLPLLLPLIGSNAQSIVKMDNAAIHHVDRNVQLIENTSANILTSLFSRFQPIRNNFSKVKAIMKENDKLFQTTSAPKTLLKIAFSLITSDNCFNFSKHCEYVY